jgi:hypothetical protein
VQAHRDGCRDELAPEAEDLDRLRADAHRPEPSAWDAWDDAPRDVAGAADLRRELADEGAEKLAGQAQDGRAQDAFRLVHRVAVGPEQRFLAAEPCRPDAGLSAAQSCAAQAVAADRSRRVQRDAAVLVEFASRSKLQS